MGGPIPKHTPFGAQYALQAQQQQGTAHALLWESDELVTPAGPAALPPPHYMHKVNIKGPGWNELRRLCDVLDLSAGALIAGGACRRALQGVPLTDGDIDVYALGGSLDAVRGQLRKACVVGGEFAHTTPNGEVWGRDFKVPCGGEVYRVQLLEFQSHCSSPEWILRGFDLSCVSAAFNAKTHEVTMDTAFENDNATRTLRFRRIRSANAMLRRLEKYVALGYSMEPDHRKELAAYLAAGVPAGDANHYGDED